MTTRQPAADLAATSQAERTARRTAYRDGWARPEQLPPSTDDPDAYREWVASLVPAQSPSRRRRRSSGAP